MRVRGDDGELRPWHYLYVYSIESRLNGNPTQGHSGPIQDLGFSPFQNTVVASARYFVLIFAWAKCGYVDLGQLSGGGRGSFFFSQPWPLERSPSETCHSVALFVWPIHDLGFSLFQNTVVTSAR